MDNYEVIGAYAVLAFFLFGLAMAWRRYRETIKKRFHLLNYHPKGDDPEATHPI